jgi:hypothetical protein
MKIKIINIASLFLLICLTVSTVSASTEYTPKINNGFVLKGDGTEVRLINNENAKNPTYDELIEFIENDSTDIIPYQKNVWTCGHYATAVHNNAEKAGIRAGIVITKSKNWSHGFNIFEVQDGKTTRTVLIDCMEFDSFSKFDNSYYKRTSFSGKTKTRDRVGEFENFVFW